MVAMKEKVREKRGGETAIEFKKGETIFVKGVNKRKSKDKPRYDKAQVVGDIDRNVVPIKVGERVTKAPTKNVKRPPQVVRSDRDAGAGPSTSIP